jgi:replicative DNA helicase
MKRNLPLLNTAMEVGKLPPQAPDLEQAVLGAIMLEKTIMADLADVLTEAVFYVDAHRTIYAAVLALRLRREPIDILTVTQELKKRNEIDSVGGAFYITSLTNKVSSSSNVSAHAAILLQMYLFREAIRIGNELTSAGYDANDDPFAVMAAAASEIRVLNENGPANERTMAEIMPEVVDQEIPDRGIRFFYDSIDRKLRAEPGCVTIIGARPGMGKTSMMLSSAKRQAWSGHYPYLAELEMKDRNLAIRLACGECGIPTWKVKRNLLSSEERDVMAKWFVQNADLMARMLINETASITVSSLAARIDRAKRKRNVDVVWIDHFGLLSPSTKEKPGYDRTSAVSGELRIAAKELDLPFIVLCQLSRPIKGSTVRPPMLPDLRESGRIEEDAEAVAFLHRPKYYYPDQDDSVDFIIAKQRDGEDGICNLWFDPQGIRMIDVPHDPGNTPALPASIGQAVLPPERDDDSVPF